MSRVDRISTLANVASYLAIPLTCAIFAFAGAFGIFELPDSLLSVFHGFGFVWAQFWFWGCIGVAAGVILKRVRKTNLYIWFEYPGLLVAGSFALVYAGALWLRFDITTSFLAISAFLGIGLRFLFRALEVHLLLMHTLKNDSVSKE